MSQKKEKQDYKYGTPCKDHLGNEYINAKETCLAYELPYETYQSRKRNGWDEGLDPFYGAPVILMVFAKKDWRNKVYDGSLVMGNMMLAAHSLGLGSIWIHRAKEESELPEYREC